MNQHPTIALAVASISGEVLSWRTGREVNHLLDAVLQALRAATAQAGTKTPVAACACLRGAPKAIDDLGPCAARIDAHAERRTSG